MKTATLISTRTTRGLLSTPDQGVYKLDPPTTWTASDGTEHETEHVLVSAADVTYSGPETYIFPCDETGKVTDWGELHGSLKGVLDHEAALETAGYTITEADL